MRIRTLLVCLAWLGACAKAEEQPAADSAAVGMEPAAAPSSPLAAMAGTWNVATKPTSGSDTTSTLYTLTTTPDTTGWTIQFAGRPTTTPMRVVLVDGDSVVTETGPFESARRPGVQAYVRSVTRLSGAMITGTSVARYQTTGPDTVLTLRFEGTRAR